MIMQREYTTKHGKINKKLRLKVALSYCRVFFAKLSLSPVFLKKVLNRNN